VPVGTVVREIRRRADEPIVRSRRVSVRRMSREELEEATDRHFVAHPEYEGGALNAQFQVILESLLKEEQRATHVARHREPIQIDLDSPTAEPIPLVRGGDGGLGNPHFHSMENRSPKWATRGKNGEELHLELELKMIADVGLVGYPNAGKRYVRSGATSRLSRLLKGTPRLCFTSTFLRAISNSKTLVASYPFTTLRPQVGIVICYTDDTRNLPDPSDRVEASRLTVADIPGLLPDASQDVGLGHDFLRHVVRSRLLIYVIDLTSPTPEKELNVLRNELEEYEEGLSKRARLVLANKADACEEAEARAKLAKIHAAVEQWGPDQTAQVVPVSAKWKQNTEKVVAMLRAHVSEETERLKSVG
jgi:GTP-binding protein